MTEYSERRRWFAWRPVRTRDKGWVWWRWTWRERWVSHAYTFGEDVWFVYYTE